MTRRQITVAIDITVDEIELGGLDVPAARQIAAAVAAVRLSLANCIGLGVLPGVVRVDSATVISTQEEPS